MAPTDKSGRLSSCDSVTLWSSSLLSVCNREASAATVTDSVDWPAWSATHRLPRRQVEVGVCMP